MNWKHIFNKLLGPKPEDISKYSAAFYLAKEFSTQKGFPIDSNVSSYVDNGLLCRAVRDITTGFAEQLNFYRHQKRDPYNALGSDCGNIHQRILAYIKEDLCYSALPINLTIGEVKIDEKNSFVFTREKFCSWLDEKPEILDCHVWLTIGDEYILDATIGTYINTRIGDAAAFGGIIYGKHGDFMVQHIAGESAMTPHQIQSIEFSPIVLGDAALLACAPPPYIGSQI